MKKKFVLQWHITERCNLRCMHCYREEHEDRKPVQLEDGQLLDILRQYKELLKKLDMKGHINVTGGEPLSCPFFFGLLDEFKKDKELYSFSVLSNGIPVTDGIAREIAGYGPEYVQVSIEGGKRVNDLIRGKGTYEKIAAGIRHLKKHGIFVSVSFTANRMNYREFPKVVKYALRNGADVVWSDRYIPIGGDKTVEPLGLEETRAYLRSMQDERAKLKSREDTRLAVSMYRALQFQMTNDFPYACTAGDTLLTVMENGDLAPCRRLPIVCGNLLEENMCDLYADSPVLRQLRAAGAPDGCMGCEHEKLCRGGLKCLTYALHNDFNYKDCGCDYQP